MPGLATQERPGKWHRWHLSSPRRRCLQHRRIFVGTLSWWVYPCLFRWWIHPQLIQCANQPVVFRERLPELA